LTCGEIVHEKNFAVKKNIAQAFRFERLKFLCQKNFLKIERAP